MGRGRDMTEDLGGEVRRLLSDVVSACEGGIALPVDDRFSAIDVEAVLPDVVLIVRLCGLFVLLLVVRDGMAGPAPRGDCGSLVELVLDRSDPGIAIFDGVADVPPVRAASDCARAASASSVVSSSASHAFCSTDTALVFVRAD